MKVAEKQRGRPSKGDKARVVSVTVKLSAEDLQTLEKNRGNVPRASYLRDKGLAS